MKDKKDMCLWLQVDEDVTDPDIRSALSDKGITRCILRPLPEYDWSAFRREAAKDFVAAMLRDNEGQWADCDLVSAAIEIADELIKQLKEK